MTLRSASSGLRCSALVAALACLGAACSGGGPADRAGDRLRGRPEADAAVEASTAPADTTTRIPAQPTPAGARPSVLVKANARAILLNSSNVYYGDTVDDGVYVIPKAGGEPRRIARRAPTSRTFAIDNDEISWVANPGDAVLRTSLHSGAFPATIRDRGIFADVAAIRGDVFVTEILGAGGALTRITGPTAARLTQFEGTPRGLAVDGDFVYVVTPTRVFRTPHVRGELETIAIGANFEWPVLDGGLLYLLSDGEGPKRRAIVAVPKKGGTPTTIVKAARDAPFAIEGGELVWFDAAKPQLVAMPTSGATSGVIPRVVAEDERLALPTALALDATTAFVAAGAKDVAAILTIARGR